MLLQRRLGGVNEVVVDKHRRTRRALNMVGHSSFIERLFHVNVFQI